MKKILFIARLLSACGIIAIVLLARYFWSAEPIDAIVPVSYVMFFLLASGIGIVLWIVAPLRRYYYLEYYEIVVNKLTYLIGSLQSLLLLMLFVAGSYALQLYEAGRGDVVFVSSVTAILFIATIVAFIKSFGIEKLLPK